MQHFIISTTAWSATPVVKADTFYRRLRGIRIVPVGHGLLLDTASVHGVGMPSPLATVGLADDGEVIAVGLLTPSRFWGHRDARMILEMPPEWALPRVGEHVSVAPIVGVCPESSTCAPHPSATSAT